MCFEVQDSGVGLTQVRLQLHSSRLIPVSLHRTSWQRCLSPTRKLPWRLLASVEVLAVESQRRPGLNLFVGAGSGLGLAIVKKLVELMRGRIVVRSRLDYGSTFAVILPCGLTPPRKRSNDSKVPLAFAPSAA
jgi:light-regulated signal transduction histidine kinase (bacteriophytochrome)